LLGDKGADITIPRWEVGAVGKVLSFVEDAEAIKTFNMGWGWIVIVPADQSEAAASIQEGALVIGEVDGSGTVKVEISN
jgi:phosphoribosylaminoimidazole (AIR) synthetase